MFSIINFSYQSSATTAGSFGSSTNLGSTFGADLGNLGNLPEMRQVYAVYSWLFVNHNYCCYKWWRFDYKSAFYFGVLKLFVVVMLVLFKVWFQWWTLWACYLLIKCLILFEYVITTVYISFMLTFLLKFMLLQFVDWVLKYILFVIYL